MYLPPGATPPTPAAVEAFAAAARAAGALGTDEACQVRWIGVDAPSTRQIFDLIRMRDKTGTFTLPWIVERTDQPEPAVDDHIILIDFDGTPTLLVRLTKIDRVKFGEVTAADTAIDGSPVRDPAIWKPLHTRYWNGLLEPFGLAVADDMPFWAEGFELVYERTA